MWRNSGDNRKSISLASVPLHVREREKIKENPIKCTSGNFGGFNFGEFGNFFLYLSKINLTISFTVHMLNNMCPPIYQLLKFL